MNEQKKKGGKILLLFAFFISVGFFLQSNTVSAGTTHTCTVIFISDDGTSVPTKTIKQGEYLTSLPTPTREGYTFSGWYLDEKLTLKISSYYISVQNYDNVLVLYAGWTKIRVSSIVATYATQKAAVDSTLDRTKINVIALYSNGTKGTITDFTVSDLKVSSIGINVYYVTYDNCTTSFYVAGIPKQYFSVTFISNGGTNVDKIPQILNGDTIILPKDPTRSGYTFEGWYQDSSFTLPFNSKTEITYNMFAFAKWKKDVIEDETVVYTLNETNLFLRLYEEDNLFVESFNGDLENYVTYKSSNSSVVKVDKTGRVVGVNYGNAIIYVIAPDGSLLKCKVQVSPKYPATKIRTNVTTKKLKVGDTFQIKTTIFPSNVSIKTVKYYSSKKTIARVSSSGKVNAKKKGICYITVKTMDGTDLKKKVKVIVN